MMESSPIPITLDIRTYKMPRDGMRKIHRELRCIRPGSNMGEKLVAKLELPTGLFAGITVEEPIALEPEDAMIGGWHGDNFRWLLL